MPFVPENRIEEVLLRAADDVLVRPEFYRLLMTETLIVAGEIVRDESDGRPQGLKLAMIRHNGRDFHPIFTSFTRLKALGSGEIRHFAMTGRDLFLRTKGADFALNPNSELGKRLMAGEIAFWLDPSARARRTLARNPPHAMITIPQKNPPMLEEALRVLFKNRHDVVAAYLLEIAFSDRSEPAHPLIVIETEGSFPHIARDVSELSAAILPAVILDVIHHDRNHPDPEMAQPLAVTPPFYQRTSSE